MRKNDVVFITGASAGIGRAVAERFGEQGSFVGLFARDEERLNKVREQIEAHGSRALVVTGDVSRPEDIENAAELVEETFGPIDIWVNDAMTTVFAPFSKISPDEFKRVTEVTYLGYVYGTMSALKRMRKRNRGSIVQVGSALAYRSIPLQSAYCGAKHAIQGFTESIRSELIHEKSKVRITMVQLPAVNTPQFEWCKAKLDKEPQPVPPIYQPEIAARAIVWAAYHNKRELNVGINTSIIIWLNKFFPGLGDKYLSKKGYSGQMTKEPIKAGRISNLWAPVKGNFGAHGKFNDTAVDSSNFLWLATHSKLVWSVLLLIILFTALIVYTDLPLL